MEASFSADKLLGGLWGVVVGDALGVPVEFVDRESLRKDPVTGMRGHGTHHQPPGTWSDDTSLTLCTVESLLSGFDLRDLAEKFVRWCREGYWTPWGRAFDIGYTTREAIARLAAGVPPEEAGLDNAHPISNLVGGLNRPARHFARISVAAVPEGQPKAPKVRSTAWLREYLQGLCKLTYVQRQGLHPFHLPAFRGGL